MINEQRMREEFCELVRIPCHSRNERQIADVLKAKLKELGASSVVEDNAGEAINGTAGNVIATFNANLEGVKTLMLSAHMDCVEPCEGIEPILEDGVFRSKGDTILGGDDKVGVVGILEALRVIKEKQLPHGKIVVVFCVCEEGGLNGSKNLDASLVGPIDLAFVADSSTRPGHVVNQAPGQNGIDIVMKGVRAHAGVAPEKGLNAIVVMGAALAKVPQGRIDAETTANIGSITGGIATNIVPDTCSVKAEARSLNNEALEKQTQAMVDAIETVAKEYNTTCEITVAKKYQPYHISEDTATIQIAKKAIEALGMEFTVGPTGGGSDANNFNKHGIPAVVLGTGMTNVHTVNETLKEQDLYSVGKIITQIIEEVVHDVH